MQVETLPGAGAEIHGVDLGRLTDNELDAIRAQFVEHGLLFFRDQAIDERQHIAFASRFGDININRFFTAHPEFSEIAMVTKEPDQQANIGGGWHTDHSYDHAPALGSILVARELPKTGGDTWFCSMYAAYESFSAGLQQVLEGLDAVHSARHVFGSQAVAHRRATEGRLGHAEAADELEDPVHPVVIHHPLSGRRALYVNPAFTLRFSDWTEAESAPLLAYLYEQAVAETHVTRFEWRPGSVAFWDNRATWHFAQNDYQGERRVMHRITIEGCPLQAAREAS